MNTIKRTFLDSTLYGHRLVQPLLWYGRQVSQVFKDPLPKGTFATGVDLVRRAVVLALLTVGSFSLLVTVPSALAGLAVKYRYLPQPPKEEAPVIKTNDQDSKIEIPPFIAPSEETIQEAQNLAEQLDKWVQNIPQLDEHAANEIFRVTQHFYALYRSYRNPDPSASDPLKKIFATIESIDGTVLSMRESQNYYNDFCRRRASEHGVIEHSPDGNCWLSVAFMGLQHLNHPKAEGLTIPALREKIVQWMQDNYERDLTFQQHVANGIENFQFSYVQQKKEEFNSAIALILMNENLSPEELNAGILQIEAGRESLDTAPEITLEDYFAHMRQDKSFGGYAEYYAFSQIFGVNVEIWRELRKGENEPITLSKELDTPIIVNPSAPTIYPVMTLAGNHFNSLLPPNGESHSSVSSSSSSCSSSSSSSSSFSSSSSSSSSSSYIS